MDVFRSTVNEHHDILTMTTVVLRDALTRFCDANAAALSLFINRTGLRSSSLCRAASPFVDRVGLISDDAARAARGPLRAQSSRSLALMRSLARRVLEQSCWNRAPHSAPVFAP
jgi:hypothetical protein